MGFPINLGFLGTATMDLGENRWKFFLQAFRSFLNPRRAKQKRRKAQQIRDENLEKTEKTSRLLAVERTTTRNTRKY